MFFKKKPDKLLSVPLAKSDEQLWRQWANKTHSIPDLLRFLGSEVKEPFKKRVIAILLVPDRKHLQFYWEGSVNPGSDTDFFHHLSPELLRYAWALVSQFGRKAKDIETIAYYNICSGYIFHYLNDDRVREEILQRYIFVGLDSTTIYYDTLTPGPLRRLLEPRSISDQWKREADCRYRELIKAEIAAGRKLHNSDYLLCEYGKILGFGRIIPNYSVELYADQIEFVIAQTGLKVHGIFFWDSVYRVFQVLANDKYRDLRHRYTRFMLFDNGGWPFGISDNSSEAIDMMENEFCDDLEIATRLRELRREQAIEDQVAKVSTQDKERKREKEWQSNKALLRRMSNK
ncbi:MAG: hypothetical protein V1838_03990 [Patescibacteria group bacterium]